MGKLLFFTRTEPATHPLWIVGWNKLSIPNFNGAAVEVWEWIGNFTLYWACDYWSMFLVHPDRFATVRIVSRSSISRPTSPPNMTQNFPTFISFQVNSENRQFLCVEFLDKLTQWGCKSMVFPWLSLEWISFATQNRSYAWWRHQMETFSALLAICAWNSRHKGQWCGALMFFLSAHEYTV